MRAPAIPASVAAFVMLAGIALAYWSLTSFGALVPKNVNKVGKE